MDTTDVAIVLVAAGRGSRAGGDLPKQYRRLAGRPVIARTLAALSDALPEALIAPVIHPDDADLFATAVAGVPARLMAPVHGGATRQASVRAGLGALPASTRIVLIHDAARPFCSPALVRAAVAAARAHGAAIPGVAVVDALASVDADGRITGAVDRGPLRAAQTPQAFDFALIRDAHAKAAAAGRDDFADDAAVAAFAGAPVFVFPGEAGNLKLTTNEDFSAAEARAFMALADVRVGTGFDVHAFGDGDHVWLGGVRVPHTRAMVGHSDADVLLHALTDALLGALGDGDIGAHFPPSDPRWKGAASDQFLADACARVAARGGVIAHLDGTIICEAPKVGPHREAIRASVARIAGLDIGRVAIKATTTEQLGFAGRREGIAAQAVATIRLPLEGA